MGKNGNRIDANYTEEEVGIVLEMFLSLMSFPRKRFSIEPFSQAEEHQLGADARLYSAIQGFRPFYMQFKKPSAYPDYSKSKIIVDRKNIELCVEPRALFFRLRNKKKKQRDFQHNVLLRLRSELTNRGIGDAAYVCPLSLDRTAYRRRLHWSGLALWFRVWRHLPWKLENVLLRDGGRAIQFDRLPILAEHITIPPHIHVTHDRHNYSFTESGEELCFHSPEALPDGSMKLASFLSKLAVDFLGDGQKLSAENSGKVLSELIEGVYDAKSLDAERFKPDADDPIGQWFEWGDHLRNRYSIEQYAFVQWRESAIDFL